MQINFIAELDDDGYPTDETLDGIRNCSISSPSDCEELMKLVVEPIWTFKNYIMKDDKTGYWFVSTGGWSGNEDIIEALQENALFMTLYWIQSRTGGHYIFGDHKELPIDMRTDLKLKRELFMLNKTMAEVGEQLAHTVFALLNSLPNDDIDAHSMRRAAERWNEQVWMYRDFIARLEEIDENFYREYEY